MKGSEFFEGVRCLLVDKNDKPRWEFRSVGDIKPSDVSSYFRPFEDKSKELAI